MRLIKEIMNLLLGYKYRAVILKDRGVERYWICSYIFEDTPGGNARLNKYLQKVEASVKAHVYWETITFRSRRPYGGILKECIAEQMNELKAVRKDTENVRRYTENADNIR